MYGTRTRGHATMPFIHHYIEPIYLQAYFLAQEAIVIDKI